MFSSLYHLISLQSLYTRTHGRNFIVDTMLVRIIARGVACSGCRRYWNAQINGDSPRAWRLFRSDKSRYFSPSDAFFSGGAGLSKAGCLPGMFSHSAERNPDHLAVSRGMKFRQEAHCSNPRCQIWNTVYVELSYRNFMPREPAKWSGFHSAERETPGKESALDNPIP